MSSLYPIYLDLRDRDCLVVGGGRVATRKIAGLLEAGARVTVVSPRISEEVEAWRANGQLTWIASEFHEEHLEGKFLAHVATPDPAVSDRVLVRARELGIPVCATGRQETSDFQTPARGSAGAVQIAVSTGGARPGLAAEIRDRLVEHLRELEAVRDATSGPAAGWREPARAGHVYLVGAGPGSGGLLTSRGRHLLRTCDVVYYDRLVGPELIDDIPPETLRIYVGKERGSLRPNTGELLAEAARRGQSVVRLKGGDPNLFGRGGEEMVELLEQEIPFEVVPGVSALTAVPSAAGIPVTYRSLARQVIIRSGYRLPDPDSHTLPRSSSDETTYVYFMTVGRLSEIVEELTGEDGLDPSTPIAIIQKGTLPGQKVVTGTLASIVERVERVALTPPALVVAGQVVRFATTSELEGIVREASHDSGPPPSTPGGAAR